MDMTRLSSFVGRLSLSLRAQLALFTVVSFAVPILLYLAFGTADREKDALLLDAVRGQDLVIAKALAPRLAHVTPSDFGDLTDDLGRLAEGDTNLKLLYKPNGAGGEAGFFLVASAPAVTPDDAATERKALVDLGILERLAVSCAGDQPLGERVVLSGEKREILTSVAPLKTDAGCWVLVVADDSRSLLGEVSSRPYLQRPGVQAAMAIYIATTALALVVFVNIWRTLSRFRRVARDIEAGHSFAGTTQIPEFAEMATEVDRMVGRLNQTAALLRRSAEDNAHAFKTPIAIIRQSLEMLRRPIGPELTAAGFNAIDASLSKLDGLVRSARRLDVATADMLDLARHVVDLSGLVEGFAAEHRLMLADRADRLVVKVTPSVAVNGREELLETILENLVDNALSFSPPGGRVFVTLSAAGGTATLEVADEGPGVVEERLESIFERYHSDRPPTTEEEGATGDAHYGVGLWIVRQHAQAMGGYVVASNRPEGGLVVTVTIPLARSDMAAAA